MWPAEVADAVGAGEPNAEGVASAVVWVAVVSAVAGTVAVAGYAAGWADSAARPGGNSGPGG
ncbi:hypothetical protein BKG61_24830 [Mycobacterium syngnathidarum]|uniref:Uncharacterized protein n=1 Tax=Mycobacterium syngnathidarum TaxID=1908205 RepID=A0A1S1JUB1_9MYCO|nr:hypothetical protein BKG61_24830 [Mycobacterium syngnathidarum]